MRTGVGFNESERVNKCIMLMIKSGKATKEVNSPIQQIGTKAPWSI